MLVEVETSATYWYTMTPVMSSNVLPRDTVGFFVPSSGDPTMTVSGFASGTPSGPA